MALIPLDLPDPMSLRGRWAALAAVEAAVGRGDDCKADGPLWHYDDGDGSWADLHRIEGGRAVLLGQDRHDSRTFYAEASDFFEEEETDLLAGAPEWWEPAVRRVRDSEQQLFLGFVYGFDGSGWYRAEYDLEDGFGSVGLPALSADRTRERIHATVQAAVQAAVRSAVRQGSGGGGRRAADGAEREVDPGAVDALIAADGAVDAALVAAAAPHGSGSPSSPSSPGWDPEAGAAAARAFLMEPSA
ncbi:proteophosphoglycan 5 [Streptomyces sp. NBC_01012]|uniref:proteophosphoglycan 5 n=1 Tax=Streptomyces sp. NBC_01012 TaxID=2903717 RepID=UPI00386EAFA8|nr:proteophosphoglycan 5 [Streptomyces sp. NBC_01012]